MKKFIAIVVCALTLICSTVFVGCNGEGNKTPENSHIISIYSENYSQKENGEVVFDGYKHKKTFTILDTKMFELDIDVIETEDGNKLGKYSYTGLDSGKLADNKKIQIFPDSNMTIFLRERQLKNINLFYKGKEITYYLSTESKTDYADYFISTYEEDFKIYSSYIEEVISLKEDFTIELYNNKDFVGEPFAESYITYSKYYESYSGSISFKLIESTDVYIKVVTEK